MAVRPHCSICQEYHQITSFRFLPCGHGFCAASIEQYATTMRVKKPCPICRERFILKDAHPIYIEVAHSDTLSSQPRSAEEPLLEALYSRVILKQAVYAGEQIKCIGAASSTQAVQRAAQEISKVVEGLDREPCTVEALLSTIGDYLHRIAPIFTTVSEQERELASLKGTLCTKEAEGKRMNKEVEKAQHLTLEALDTADRARHELVKAREENDKLQRRMNAQAREYGEQLTTHSEEMSVLHNALQAHKAKESKQKAKIQSLRQRLKDHEDTIDSLRQSASRTPVLTRGPRRQTSRPTPSLPHGEDSDVLDIYPTEEGTVIGSDCDLEYLDPEPLRPLPALFPALSNVLLPPGTPQRPKFDTDWNLKPPQNRGKRKRTVSLENNASASSFPIALDSKGRAKGTVQLGSRRRLKIG
ncbi:hypothetical protein AcW1_006532 [Taiwanofungus camphoratus]|nr:hypothetical protein AcV5_009120 [Antrodia cinnamomea]KAI0924408.1 hypothetical protein AcW2_005293 [Antrodia cinnamomea]KAI0940749.1 hypothetical protein AcV7_003045 [Antrodia cinnamomea]KAI0954739.1 hypothetical protein AcW1_006532 [Antrodia cinnamomea]